MPKHKVLVIGGGFAGLAAARRLSGDDFSVTLVDKTNHHLFQPLLYQVATAGLNPSEIASPLRQLFKAKSNVTTLMASLSSVDYESNLAWFDDGSFSVAYDSLILAIGGQTSYFGKDHWRRIAPGLKSLDDALTIRQKVLYSFECAEKTKDKEEMEALMTIVVVGGGPTGVEMAGAFAELRTHVLRWDFRKIDPQQAKVILIEGSDEVLGNFPDTLGKYARNKLEQMGVEIFTSERVSEIGEDFVQTPERKIRSNNIIWTAGVGGNKINSLLCDKTTRAGKIIVEEDLRIAGRDNVYCVGDMAHYAYPHTFGGAPIPGVAPAAMQQGKRAAKNVIRQVRGKKTKKFNYFDKGSMATIGRSAAVALTPEPLRMKITGLFAWLAWLFVHLLYIVDYRNRLLVLMRWTWKYISWRWNVRLITAPKRYNVKSKKSTD